MSISISYTLTGVQFGPILNSGFEQGATLSGTWEVTYAADGSIQGVTDVSLILKTYDAPPIEGIIVSPSEVTYDISTLTSWSGNYTDYTVGESGLYNIPPLNISWASKFPAILIGGSVVAYGTTLYASNDGSITEQVLCFSKGTHILTPCGERPVEDLSAGDIVITNSGLKPPIKWIGKRCLDLSRHPNPEKAYPIRFDADCFAADVPTRDLFLSPDHALYIDGILVPAKALINGKNICQVVVPTVTYCHIELDEHSVVFAENTPAETYLETGNRGAFENCDDAMTLHPDFGQAEREANGCAPFMESGPQVEAIRKRILDRANIQTTDDPAMTVEYHNGRAIIQSRYAIPGLIMPDPRDRRRLGVKVASIIVGGRYISFDHPALVEGWHDVEPDGRWTDGSAVIPVDLLAGANDVTVILAATLPYPVAV